MTSRRATIAGALALTLIASGHAGAAPPQANSSTANSPTANPSKAGSSNANPFLGTWTYVAEGSKFAGRAPYRSATITFAAAGKGMRVSEEVVTANGAKFLIEYVDPMDGTFVPVKGNPYYDTESTAWTDGRTLERTERRKEQRTGTTVMTVAPDGQTFIADAKRTVPEGHLYTAYVVWKRATP